MTANFGDHLLYKNEQQKKERQKELLKMYRWALTKLPRVNCKTLRVDARIRITEDKEIIITVFENDGTNCFMNLYDFYETERSRKSLERFIAAIKTDDFANVEAQSQA